MKSVGPLTKSFSPENEQIELACEVSLGVPGLPMLPGGPITSPARAALAPAPARAAAQSAAARNDCLRIDTSPSRSGRLLSTCQRRPAKIVRFRAPQVNVVGVDLSQRPVLVWSRCGP